MLSSQWVTTEGGLQPTWAHMEEAIEAVGR